jgi:glycogen synthase
MKVCLISDEYLKENPLGGIGTYTKQLGKTLIALGDNVSVLTFSGHPRKIEEGNLSVVAIKKIQIPKFSLIIDPFLVFLELLKLNKHKQIDVIEVPEWRALGFFIVIFRKIFRSLPPVIVRLHTPLVLSRFYNSESLSVLDRVRDWMEGFTVKHCDEVTCPTQLLSLWAKKKWGLNRLIKNIPNFIELPSVDSDCLANCKGNTILFMGSLASLKGFDVFLKAVSKLLDETEANCCIMGRKTSDQELNSMLDDVLSKYKNVKYLGFLQGTAKIKALEQADVVVIPSLWDNFPLVCVEAMAASKIVVASSVGGLKEIISNGNNGFLIPAGDYQILASTLKAVLNMDKKQKNYITKNARNTVESKYSSTIVGKAIQAFYLDSAQKSNKIKTRKSVGKNNGLF